MWIVQPERDIAWISNVTAEAIKADAKRAHPRETGGVLLGYWAGNQRVVVTDAIGAGPQALHDTVRLLPDSTYHQREVKRRYEESGRRITYLGDWHTHPVGGLSPSWLDRRTLSRIQRDSRARAPDPLMIITSGAEEMKVWRALRCSGVRDLCPWLGARVVEVSWRLY